ncbi:hypothetical protein ACFQ0M_40330 [Kitasatospora aburaviensis]
MAPDLPASEATLAGVASAYRELRVPFDATQVVSLNADRPGMFRRAPPCWSPATWSRAATPWPTTGPDSRPSSSRR